MGAKTQVSGARGSVEGARPESLLKDSVPFMSMCPRCTRVQLQDGFSRAALQVLLRDGQPVEAYCVMCHQFWPINSRERVELAKAVTDSEAVDESVPFTAICPKCFEEQPQRGYSGAALRGFLKGNRAIEAYCVRCDAFWDISPHERAAVTWALAR